MEYFQWKIVENAVKPGVINLVWTSTGIGSVTSLTPKVLFFKGQPFPASEIGDTFTDPAYQRQGMFSLLVNQTRRDGNSLGIDLIYGTPNDQSLPGYEKHADFKTIAGISVRTLNFPVHVQLALRTRLPWIIASVVGFLWTLLVQSWLWVQRLLNSRHAWHIEEVTVLPADWESFWDEARSPYDFLFSREREFLKWRYFDNPYRYHVFIARRAGRICGYLIYRLVPDERMPTLRIADYLSAPGEERVLASLLNCAVRAALETGAVKVSAWCPSSNPHFRQFRAYGFQTGGEIPVICHQSAIARKIEQECQTWHFTLGDSDNV
jgi:GNAT superfamily N-acetyltransferase